MRIASLVVLAVAATLWLQNTAELLRFVVTVFGRLPIITPVFVYAAMLAVAGLMVVPPLIAAFAAGAAAAAAVARNGAVPVARLPSARARYVAPAYTDDAAAAPACARAAGGGRHGACGKSASIEPGLDLGDGAPSRMDAGATRRPCRCRAWGTLPHPFVFRTTGPSLGPAPIADCRASRRAGRGRDRAAVTAVPAAPGLAISFVLPAGLEPARSSLPGVQRLGRWTAIFVAPPAEGIVWPRQLRGKIAPPALRDLADRGDGAGRPRLAAAAAVAAPQRTSGRWTRPGSSPPLGPAVAPVPPLR